MASETIVLDGKQAHELFTNGKLEEVIAFYRMHGNNVQLSCVNRNPLHFAVNNTDPLVLLYLLKYQNLQRQINEKDDLDNRPLGQAAVKGCLKHVEILLFYGADETLPMKLIKTLAGTLGATCLLPYPDQTIKEFIAKRESGAGLPEETQLEREVERINAKLSTLSNKPQANTFINQLACSISYWLRSARPSNSPYPAEKPAEQVPLIVKKTM